MIVTNGWVIKNINRGLSSHSRLLRLYITYPEPSFGETRYVPLLQGVTRVKFSVWDGDKQFIDIRISYLDYEIRRYLDKTKENLLSTLLIHMPNLSD